MSVHVMSDCFSRLGNVTDEMPQCSDPTSRVNRIVPGKGRLDPFGFSPLHSGVWSSKPLDLHEERRVPSGFPLESQGRQCWLPVGLGVPKGKASVRLATTLMINAHRDFI